MGAPGSRGLLGSERSLTVPGYISPSGGKVHTSGLEAVWFGTHCKERAG